MVEDPADARGDAVDGGEEALGDDRYSHAPNAMRAVLRGGDDRVNRT
jgi:hypothetical protein